MNFHDLLVIVSCVAVIPLTGRFSESIRARLGIWSFLVMLPVPLLAIYAVYRRSPAFLPIVLAIFLMLLACNYVSRKE